MKKEYVPKEAKEAGSYCFFNATKILLTFLQTHSLIMTFRDNYNEPTWSLLEASSFRYKANRSEVL